MTQLEALVSLNMIKDIGSIRLKKLLEVFDKPENILRASFEKLTSIFGIGEKIAQEIVSFKEEDLDKELDLARKYGLKILTQDNKDYPENLKNIYDPPIVLYVKGEINPIDKLSIAIVGSRRSSFYGLEQAKQFAKGLSALGFTVVSGLARGIDTQAHKGALLGGGRTIAVIGSGFKYMYPPENKELAEDIAKKGAVISEFPIETEPIRQNFPRRNRVISGLSLGVMVVEAGQNSGALITADFALEQGREVFALPGKVDSPNAFGTNGLIKQGARLVSSVDDIIEEFNLDMLALPKERPLEKDGFSQQPKDNLLPDEERLIYNALSSEPLTWDDIIERTGIKNNKLSRILLSLQMRRLIKQLPGKQFLRCEDEKSEFSYC